tara:strand:- start:439 stop:612 length:174 start_codon:yes stop_codon:yes gene_type:complete
MYKAYIITALIESTIRAEPIVPLPIIASKSTCSNIYTLDASNEKARYDSTVTVLTTA